MEKQGEVDVLEAFELYQYKVSFKQFIPLNTISIRSKTVTRLLWVNSIFLTYFLATDGSAESRDECRVRGVGSLAGGREVFGVIQVVQGLG